MITVDHLRKVLVSRQQESQAKPFIETNVQRSSEMYVQWNSVNKATSVPWKFGRIDEVGPHYGATRFKSVLHMNTFNSQINQPFYSFFLTLQTHCKSKM